MSMIWTETEAVDFLSRHKKQIKVIGVVIMVGMTGALVALILYYRDFITWKDLLYVAGCMMTAVPTATIGICFEVGHYGGEAKQDLIYQTLLGGSISALWINLFCAYDRTFMNLPKKKDSRLRILRTVITAVVVTLIITNHWTGFFYRK